MAQPPSTFRDTGLLPEGLTPPAGTVHCFLSPSRVAAQVISTVVISAVGLGLAALFALTMPPSLRVLAPAATLLAFAALVYLATRNDYRWIDLEGDTLRAKHLYTGRVVERPVAEIESLLTLSRPSAGRAETAVAQRLLGRVKGVEIRFRDGRTPLRVQRSDPAMTNAQELIEGVLYLMSRVRPIETEVVPFEGQPLVRSVFWKGEPPAGPRNNNSTVILVSLILMALTFGVILGYINLQEGERLRWGSVPPHEVPLAELARNGPGPNRHVTVTDFRPGGYAVETGDAGNGRWTQVWVALFPEDSESAGPCEIRVVLSSANVRDERDLGRLLDGGRVTGICRESPQRSWGTELGPRLRKMNPGCSLSSAWVVEELREPPSAERVKATGAGSAACFAAVVFATAILLWKR